MARKQSAVNMRLINLFPSHGACPGSNCGCVHAGENNASGRAGKLNVIIPLLKTRSQEFFLPRWLQPGPTRLSAPLTHMSADGTLEQFSSISI